MMQWSESCVAVLSFRSDVCLDSLQDGGLQPTPSIVSPGLCMSIVPQSERQAQKSGTV